MVFQLLINCNGVTELSASVANIMATERLEVKWIITDQIPVVSEAIIRKVYLKMHPRKLWNSLFYIFKVCKLMEIMWQNDVHFLSALNSVSEGTYDCLTLHLCRHSCGSDNTKPSLLFARNSDVEWSSWRLLCTEGDKAVSEATDAFVDRTETSNNPWKQLYNMTVLQGTEWVSWDAWLLHVVWWLTFSTHWMDWCWVVSEKH
jgi:hypothetical protein